MSNFARKVQMNQLKKQYGNKVFKTARAAEAQEKEKTNKGENERCS
jgi:hypothetical protein